MYEETTECTEDTENYYNSVISASWYEKSGSTSTCKIKETY
ncbi:MAG TPA: hypothetical protein VER35_03275 [Candidatus Limnocylindrales bacterium]|nr:hypothetical protein [Candidatus Limnocylindrales bacterium]